jgi:drug/metabolite transporter (DMT)-like permease
VPPARLSQPLYTLSGLVAIVLWSTTFAGARSLSEQVGPITAAAVVYLTGGVLGFIPSLLRSSRSSSSQPAPSRRYLYGCGALFVSYTLFVYLAVGLARDRAQLLEVALINYLWPAGTILLSLPLLRQQASLWLWPATLLALSGVFLVMTQGSEATWESAARRARENPEAYLLALAAAVTWAFYSNLARRWTRPDQAGAVRWFVLVTGLALFALRGLRTESSAWSVRAVLEASALGAISTIAYALWDVAIRKGNLLVVAASSYSTPLLSTVVSCVYLGVNPGPNLWTGSLLIMTGSIVSWWSVARSEPSP